jgi:hypothetical protein
LHHRKTGSNDGVFLLHWHFLPPRDVKCSEALQAVLRRKKCGLAAPLLASH